MKTFLSTKTVLVLLFACFALQVASAQTTNILTIRATYDTITAGATNSVFSLIKWDSSGSKRDQLNLAGVQYAWAVYTNALGTNGVPMGLQDWLKTNVFQVTLGSYVQQKQQADNAVLLNKITALLTSNSDLLTAGDLSSLNTIAAKAP